MQFTGLLRSLLITPSTPLTGLNSLNKFLHRRSQLLAMALTLPVESVPTKEPETSVLLQASAEVTIDFITEPFDSNKAKGSEERSLTLQFPRQAVDKMLNMMKPTNPNWLQLNTPNSVADLPASGATKLRKMLFETNELIVCPGVYDGLSARTAMELGFSALYMVWLLFHSVVI